MKTSFSTYAFALITIVIQSSFAQQSSSSSSSTSIPGAESPSTATGLSSAEISVPVSSEGERKAFGISFFSLGGINSTQLERPDPSYYIYDGYIGFNYRLSKTLRVSARPAFNYSTEGLDYQGNPVTNKMTTRDFSMLATHYDVLQDYLPATMDLKVQTRMYLPTSEGSKAEGMISRLRFEIESKYYLSKYSNLRMYFKPSYFFQRTTAFLDSRNSIKTTKLGDSQHGAEADVNLNKYFSFKPGLEFEDTWTNESEVNSRDPRHESTLAYRLGLEVRPIKDINFTVGYQDRRDLFEHDMAKDISYSLMTNVAIY